MSTEKAPAMCRGFLSELEIVISEVPLLTCGLLTLHTHAAGHAAHVVAALFVGGVGDQTLRW